MVIWDEWVWFEGYVVVFDWVDWVGDVFWVGVFVGVGEVWLLW